MLNIHLRMYMKHIEDSSINVYIEDSSINVYIEDSSINVYIEYSPMAGLDLSKSPLQPNNYFDLDYVVRILFLIHTDVVRIIYLELRSRN
jgi:hypothetical protein